MYIEKIVESMHTNTIIHLLFSHYIYTKVIAKKIRAKAKKKKKEALSTQRNLHQTLLYLEQPPGTLVLRSYATR